MKTQFTPKGPATAAASVIMVLICLFLHPVYDPGISSSRSSSIAHAADRDGSPYGSSKGGVYGEKKAVATSEDARKVLREYFSGRDVKIGEVREREFYFEAEIRDRNNKPVDTVIVDKRTGRIRSIY